MDRETGIGILRRYWWIVVVLTVLGALIGALPEPERAQDQSVTYQATHTMLLASTSGNLYSDPVALNQIQLFATVGEVPKRAAAKLNLSESEVAVTPALDQNTGALSITATKDTAEMAVIVADTVADELASYMVERQDDIRNDRLAASLNRQHDLEDKIRDLEDEVAKAPDDNVKSAQLESVRNQYVVVLQQYDTLTSDDSGFLQLNTLSTATATQIVSGGIQAPRSRTTRGLLAGGLGLALGCGVAFMLARLDRRIRTRVQAESLVGMHAQVTVPAADEESLRGLAVTGIRHDALSDSYRSLRSVIEFAEGGEAKAAGRAAVIVVVSPTPGDGKTSVSSNLAAASVETGKKTIAVNADFRRPALAARILGSTPQPLEYDFDALTDVAAKSLLTRTPTAGLSLVDLSSVDAAPGDLARLTTKAIIELAPTCDTIVVDTSPMTATAEVLELIPIADVVVLVTRLNQTPINAAARTAETLRDLNPPHLLLVVVGESTDRSAYYYNYAGQARRDKRWKHAGAA